MAMPIRGSCNVTAADWVPEHSVVMENTARNLNLRRRFQRCLRQLQQLMLRFVELGALCG